MSDSKGDDDLKRLMPVPLELQVSGAICSDWDVAKRVARHTRYTAVLPHMTCGEEALCT